MFKAAFRAIAVLFGALEKGAKSIDNMALWAEETTGAFSDKARLQREFDTVELLKEFGLTEMPKPPVKSLVLAETKVKRVANAVTA